MTRILFTVMLFWGLSFTTQSVVWAAGGRISASANKLELVVGETTNGTISITDPDQPEDTNEIRYLETVTNNGPTVSGSYTPFPTEQDPNPSSSTDSGVTILSSSSFKFTGNKPGTWEETFTVSFPSIATEVYNSETEEWEPGEDHTFADATCALTFTVKAVQLTISAPAYIPVKSTLNPNRYEITITANPKPVTGTISLSASGDKLDLYQATTGGSGSTSLNLSATASTYKVYMEGKSVSTNVKDQTLTAAYSGVGTEPVSTKVTVVSVSISASRWTEKGQRSNVSLSYLPSDLDTGNIELEGDATGLFDFYETVQNEETGENEEVTASMSWGLPREENNISLVAEGKDTGDGKLTVTHSTSGAKAEVNAGVADVTLKVKELSWGKNWQVPEDTDEADIPQWHVLWTCDQHRYIVSIEPLEAHQYVSSVTISPFDQTATYNNEDWVLTNQTPSTGLYPVVKAVVSFTNAGEVESSPITIGICSINSINWVAVDESDINTHQAKLTTDTEVDHIYVVPDSFSPYCNSAKVNLQTTLCLSGSMKGTVHLAWFDPADDVDGGYAADSANTCGDNRIGLEFEGLDGNNSIEFSATSSSSCDIDVKFPEDCFSDNYIVAVHPGDGVVTEFYFGQDGETLYHSPFIGQNPPVPQPVYDEKTKTLLCVTWCGFEVKDVHYLKTPRGWVFNKPEYSLRTPLPLYVPIENGLIVSSNQDQCLVGKIGSTSTSAANDPISHLNYTNAFTINTTYRFDNYTPATGEYVVPVVSGAAQAKHPCPSFFRNSGVYIYGKYEVQLFDTRSINKLLGQGITNGALFNELKTRTNTDRIAAELKNADPDTHAISGINKKRIEIWEFENTIRLKEWSTNGSSTTNGTFKRYPDYAVDRNINGIPYGRDKSPRASGDTSDYSIPNTAVALGEENTLTIETINPTNNSIGLKISGSVANTWEGNLTSQTGSNGEQQVHGKIYLQSHWGSGVIFKSITINNNSSP
jgi:hypothetical protein